MVVPAVLDLYNGVIKSLKTAKFLRKMLVALRDSLKRRFLGIFVRCKMAFSVSPAKEGFYNKVYLAAALLDPNLDVQVESDNLEEDHEQAESSEHKEALKREIQGKYNTTGQTI